MNYKRGMGTSLIIAIIAGIFVIGGVAVYNMQPEEDIMMAEGEDMMKEGEDMMKEGEEMMKQGEDMMESAESMMVEEGMMDETDSGTSMMVEGDAMEEGEFSGDRIAGSQYAPLLEYNEADYKKAIESDRLVALYFYANWCPTCKKEFPKMEEAFDGFSDENVVGFRVNFKDTQTEDAEKELAREHGVGYQHTKVFIKNGERILKSPEDWETTDYINQITSNL